MHYGCDILWLKSTTKCFFIFYFFLAAKTENDSQESYSQKQSSPSETQEVPVDEAIQKPVDKEKNQSSVPEFAKEHSSGEEQTLPEKNLMEEEKMEVDEKAVDKSDDLTKNDSSEQMDTNSSSASEEKGIHMNINSYYSCFCSSDNW